MGKVSHRPGSFLAAWSGGRPDIWKVAAWLAAALVMAPLAAIVFTSMGQTGEVISHLVRTTLPRITGNSLVLAAGVALTTAIIGVALAWLTTMCRIPGRSFFSWALLLPLAVPAYVLAFTYLGILDFAGPLQTTARRLSISWAPDIRSTPGVILVLSMALYPYVYFITRNAFGSQGARSIEAARSLGLSPAAAFFRVALPMARPWIISGLMLVVMEVLADFGAVSILNFDTFTTAIYKAWFGFFSLPAAARLSGILVIFSFLVLSLEKRSRARMQYSSLGSTEDHRLLELKPAVRWAAFIFAALVLTVAFIIPVTQLAWWTASSFSEEVDSRYLGYFARTLLLGILAAASVCAIALISAFALRRHPAGSVPLMVRISTMGYALPGTILAVGVFIPTSLAEQLLDKAAMALPFLPEGPYIQGTLLVMIAAFAVRFMAVAFGPIDSAMQRITRSVHDSARLMGLGQAGIIGRIYLPLLRRGVLTGAILVMVDVMKEMPITLMTRPFGFETLSVKIFELTSEGEWARAALPSLTLVLAGLVPVFLLTRMTAAERKGSITNG
jgi:iron(III) transport system permease protein